jgi:prepilin-type N-terminal cleavage/methylation domain-containing protein
VNSNLQKQAGFTLIEMLIVIVILGTMAMIIVPQITVSTEDATLRSFQTNLNVLRKAVEIYSKQHDDTYPGFHNTSGAPANSGTSKAAFVAQLVKYSAIDGAVSDTKDTTHKFGPYIKGGVLPTNPYNQKNSVICDVDETNITVRESTGASGWRFYNRTGVLIANDGGHDDL